MRILIQRVTKASVEIDKKTTALIGQGLLVLCGFAPHDTEETLNKMLHKVLNYRLFSDENGKMNLSLQQIEGELLLVPQFTLMATTTQGLRPGFSEGATPARGRELFERLEQLAQLHYPKVAFGQFGADMKILLCNDGPVTFSMAFDEEKSQRAR